MSVATVPSLGPITAPEEARRSFSASSSLSSSTTLVTARGSSSSTSSPSYDSAHPALSNFQQPPNPFHQSRSQSQLNQQHQQQHQKYSSMIESPFPGAGSDKMEHPSPSPIGISFTYTDEGEVDLGVGPNSGGGDERSAAERVRIKRSKGKGKMAEPVVDIEEEEEDGEDIDEAEQERRIEMKLASWSKAEKQRRKSQRATSTLVLPPAPALPSLPLVPGATFSSLSRRGSALIRKSSSSKQARQLSQKLGIPNTLFEEAEMTLVNSSPGREGKRQWRETSSKLLDSEEPAKVNLKTNGEGSVSSIGNPFQSPPTTPSKLKNLDGIPLRINTSSFIEDLPSQVSPINAYLSHTTTAVRGTSKDHINTDHATIDYNDSIVDHLLSSVESPGPYEDVFEKKEGNNPFLDPESNFPRLHTRTTTGDTASAWQSNLTSSGQVNGEDGQGRPSSQAFPRTPSPRSYYEDQETSFQANAGTDEDEQKIDDESRPGWLDWLFCGCFGAEKGEEAQRGATNPME